MSYYCTKIILAPYKFSSSSNVRVKFRIKTLNVAVGALEIVGN